MKWSADDLDFLKDNIYDLSVAEIAEELGRTYDSVYRKRLKILGSDNIHTCYNEIKPKEKKEIVLEFPKEKAERYTMEVFNADGKVFCTYTIKNEEQAERISKYHGAGYRFRITPVKLKRKKRISSCSK